MSGRSRDGAMEAPAIAELPGGPLPYTLRHSPRARVLRVVIHPDRGVVVTVPATRSARRDGGRIPFRGRLHAVRVVPAVSGIRRSAVVAFDDELVIHRVGGERRSDAAILESWLKDEARRAIETAVARHGAAIGVDPTGVTLRDPRTRWGSASHNGRLSFSWRLILAPPEALETVVCHELAHLRVFGHGPRFWALVASRCPDHRIWRRWLHDHATELHRATADD